MISLEHVRTIFTGVCLLALLIFILKEEQCKKTNWSLFYGFIWLLFSLPLINYICVELGLWQFLDDKNSIKIPFDILFVWLLLWMLPFYIFRGKYLLIIALLLLWIDILAMPILEKYGLLRLNANWLFGEVLLIAIVFIPSYLWAKYSYNKTNLPIRASFQVLTMSMFLLIVIPFIVKTYETGSFSFNQFSMIWFQIIFIVAFPALVAVIDLVQKGNGTPFPYDKTENMVASGVYAYIRNPIQWSFTLLFIPLSIYHNSLLLCFGFIVSIAYTVGISDKQEDEDMRQRFGKKWIDYKKIVPSWYFLWKPKKIPEGTIYFRKNCEQCEDIRSWFKNRKPVNLQIVYSENYVGDELLQVTYEDSLGQEFKSVKAIAYAFEHINLAYANLGWFMRFPVINFFLQSIVDALGFSENNNQCNNK